MMTTSETRANEKRRHGRLKTEGTDSSLGEVTDISASGMKVERKGAIPVQVGEQFRVDLSIDSQVMSLVVLVRRVQKLGRRKFIYGLEFVDMSDSDRMLLTRLARIASTASRAMW